MEIKEIIEKGIQGGWLYQDEKPIYNDTQQAPCIASFTSDGISFGITLEQIVLDPLFWQAVGKTEGWGEKGDFNEEYPGDKLPFGIWEDKMMGLFNALIDGKSIKEYIATL